MRKSAFLTHLSVSSSAYWQVFLAYSKHTTSQKEHHSSKRRRKHCNVVKVPYCFSTTVTSHNSGKHETWIRTKNPEGEHEVKGASPPLKGLKEMRLKCGAASKSRDPNPIEMVLWELKRAVHIHRPSSVGALKQFCKDVRAKIPVK